MHRQETEQELERKLRSILSQSTPVEPETPNQRKKLTAGLFITLAIAITMPLWLTWDSKPATTPEPTYYKIKQVTIEYPDGLEPTIQLRPIPSVPVTHGRAGCALMPQQMMLGDMNAI